MNYEQSRISRCAFVLSKIACLTKPPSWSNCQRRIWQRSTPFIWSQGCIDLSALAERLMVNHSLVGRLSNLDGIWGTTPMWFLRTHFRHNTEARIWKHNCKFRLPKLNSAIIGASNDQQLTSPEWPQHLRTSNIVSGRSDTVDEPTSTYPERSILGVIFLPNCTFRTGWKGSPKMCSWVWLAHYLRMASL